MNDENTQIDLCWWWNISSFRVYRKQHAYHSDVMLPKITDHIHVYEGMWKTGNCQIKTLIIYETIWQKSDLYLRYRIDKSDNSPLLIVFSANYMGQSIVIFIRLKVGWTTFVIFNNTALCLKNFIWLVQIMTQYANTKFIQCSLENHQ